MKIYIGNLTYDTTEEDLNQVFESYGKLESCAIVKDSFSGRSKGFGFVEIASDEEAKAAIEGLHETELNGRTLTVNEAKPKNEKGFHGNRDGGNRGGFGGNQGGHGGNTQSSNRRTGGARNS
ncbi:MAG: RNA-binding protein [Candidatus Delongbacteria bacterium]|jgi:RNA recognition motif-containing protein|nr:RNA-binding protein [Candidatus Delongbacteria bacterium]